MAAWFSYIVGVCCIIWALMQARTALIYIGVLKSAVIPEYQTPPSALIHSAIQDAVSFLLFGILFFIFYWPKVVTYILFVLLLRAIVNLLLAFIGIGRYGLIELTNKGKIQQALLEIVPVLVYSVAATASVHFLGW